MEKQFKHELTLDEATSLRITGGKPLYGEVKPDGAKNSSLYALVAATYIREGWMTLENIPLITDIQMTLLTLKEIGMNFTIKDGAIKIYGEVEHTNISDQYASKTRASIAFLGALLSQYGSITLPLPGGDKIGDRPIDIHIDVIKSFGASIAIEGGFVKASMDISKLTGKDIFLRYPSVGATINAIFMAITASGRTTITNAAKEPEIVDLITLLSKMGADIRGGGTNRIIIEGVSTLESVNHEIIPDRLEAGALIMCFAMTGGKGIVSGSIPEHNRPLIHTLQSVGMNIEVIDDNIHIDASKPIKPFHVETQPYPGLATDLQAICTSFALVCPGTSTIKDTVFEERFAHVEELRKMGADIEKNGNKIYIHNVPHLTGATVSGGDIRCVVSLIMAALAIDDISHVGGIEHLLRGHIHFIDKLKSLHADIELI
ncbi:MULTISPECIES: UDP-N-acetylglucosamine 1-carboxyvinyltransferase [unclassified Fusibacter]|uniref:UDP-N-acetylglucosamine 1-carboxyvinyltransferase n=1 Tax=unclassified Fusibacter TaxID=2624464 RepID=UPI0010120756|nr:MULTISPECIES: UDP-N-acetylglucosamine 1-carboxyvinyltransferase [unclassified Fusibacter]MCK8060164.1 UDP-N-acetylglucosamine 1-carboxyvinyltransferase [Fusibacter sp. A2]NPE22304.1 UDP-N-acetylglucosamine 1-carboxyvinyltransferase [Fusibacter sp. A1]RXV61077.1 UDP-N-acetylglucosamine 1-carboxyvinyltransferase [Fusibacter sp. A1]